MPPKKNPLGDARKRLQEKLDSIKEQSEYITQVLTSTVSNAVDPAVELLNQKDRKKFFSKYSQVSQDLEKCLDFLLVLSDSVAVPGDSSDQSGSSDEEVDSSPELKDNENKKQKEIKDEKYKSEVNAQPVKTPLPSQEEKPENEEKPAKNSASPDGPEGTEITLDKCHRTEENRKDASSLDPVTERASPVSKATDSDQPRQNNKYPQEQCQHRQSSEDGFHKQIKDEKRELSSEKPCGNVTHLCKQEASINVSDKVQQSSVKSSCISALQESAIKRFVPSQVKMPQEYREEGNTMDVSSKTGRRSLSGVKKPKVNQEEVGQVDVSGKAGRRSPAGVLKAGRSPGAKISQGNQEEGRQVDVSGKTGRKSPATAQNKNFTTVRRGSAPKVVQLKPYPFTNGQCLEVVVTEVLSPWELWIQPTGNGFNLLMEKMCMQFAKAAASGYKGGLSSPPSVGEYCCARFTIDDTWYRARVVGLHQCDDIKEPQDRRQRNTSTSSTSSLDNSCPGLEIEVLCIDDGNRERLPLSRLRRLEDNLAVFPCQALCCALSGVKPLVQNTIKYQGDSVWRNEAIEWLRNKVSGTKLLAYPKRSDDDPLIMVDLYLTHLRRKNSVTKVPGNESTLPGLQYSIANIMVMEGFAQRVEHVAAQPGDSKNTSPRSVSSEGLLSRSCSSLSIASLQDCAMPVFEESVTQGSSVTQQDSGGRQSVTRGISPEQSSDSTKMTDHTEKCHFRAGNNVTQGSSVTQQDSGDRQSVTRGISSISTKMIEKRHYRDENHVTQQQQHMSSNSNHSKDDIDNRCKKDPKEEPAVTQSMENQEIETFCENKSLVKRESPRHPPEGSSLTESLDDQQDLNNVCPNEENTSRLYLPTQDQPLLLQVMMSEIISPSEFYVHLVTPEALLLAELTEDLDSYYQNTDITSTPVDYRLSVGDYCCSKFTDDNMWCRAHVVDIKISSSGEGGESMNPHHSDTLKANIYVFYLDYGNYEWVAMENTRPLLPKFMMLPGFAVKCRLTGVKPVGIQDENTAMLLHERLSLQESAIKADPMITTEPTDSNTQQTTPDYSSEEPRTTTEKPVSKPVNEETDKTTVKASVSTRYEKKSPKGRRGNKYRKIVQYKNVVQRAAGDESGDSELSDSGLILDWPGKGGDDEGAEEKKDEECALPEKYLLPSPDKKPLTDDDDDSRNSQENNRHEWSEEAIELFKGLTGDDKPLRAVMTPWNAKTYQQVYYPMAHNNYVDITYKRPTLPIKLYDTTGEEDVDVIQILDDTGLAEVCEEEEEENLEESIRNEAKYVRLSLSDLENTARHLEREGTIVSPVGSFNSEEMSRSSSPEESALQFWNPMMEDYTSSRNTYRIDTDDLDIAIHGFKPIENQVCRFFQSTRSKCWRGQNCPFLHVKKGEDASMMVQAFCENNDFTVELPELGSWVGVRVTAILNPGHFWVQFPCGSGPIEKKIMEARLGLSVTGKENEAEEEDFETMMERMNKFYSRNLFRDSSSILPASGELVAAKYSDNDRWYRARVTDVTDGKFQVCFVDYGNCEWTAETNVKRMLPQFLHLPFQSVECFLANVEPIEEDGTWAAKSCGVFESLTRDKLLIAHILSISRNNTMYVELFNTQEKEEVNINEEMIKQGFAVESNIKIDQPRVKTNVSSDCLSDCEIIEVPG